MLHAMKNLKLLTLITLAFFFLPISAHAQGDIHSFGPGEIDGKILILHSYHPGFTWTDNEMAGIMETLRMAEPSCEPYVEYMDCKRNPGEENLQNLVRIYRQRYAGKMLRTVITTDNAALTFALRHRSQLFPGASIVFCGVNGYDDSMIAWHSNVTGVAEDTDPAGTLEIAFRLHPDRRHVVAIFDSTESGMAGSAAVKKAVGHYKGKLRFQLLQNLTMAELLHAVEHLPGNAFIILGNFNRDREGKTFSHEEVLEKIRSRTRLPIYGLWSFLMGKGIIGGSLLSGHLQGETAARMALRILSGEKAGDIPVMRKSPTELSFDYRELSRLGISAKDLPQDSKIMFRQESFYDQYKQHVWIVFTAFACLLAVISLLGTVILQKKRNENKLRQSEQRFSTIFNTAAVSIWEEDFSNAKSALNGLRTRNVTDFRKYMDEHPEFVQELAQKLKIVDVNSTTLALYEAEGKGELLGSLERIFTPESYTVFKEILIAIAEGKDYFEAESVNRTLTGKVLDILIRITIPVKDSAFSNLLVSIIDITQRKQAERELLHFNTELEERVRERTAQLEASADEMQSFCYSVSHDLRAPLRHINSFSAILLEEHARMLDDEGRNYLQRICKGSRQMGQLIDDLLELSRVSRSEMHRESVNLSTMARTIAEELRETERERNVEVIIADDISAWGDAWQLHLVMQNLLGNAWKYTSKNPSASIRFGITEENGRLMFFVRDNGVGFDMRYADKLFGPFQRLHRADEFEGTGIGLAIVKRIILRHGGEVWGEGEPGQGATFYFHLPEA